MYKRQARYGVPYIAMHMRGTPADMPADAVDRLLFDLLQAFATPVSLSDVRREKIAGVMARSGAKGAGRTLSREEAAALLDSIRSMSARGIAVIFITHRLQEILDVCDKVIVMRDGHVVKDTPAKETNVSDITRWMVGRSVELSAAQDVVDHSGARTITVSYTHLTLPTNSRG